MPSIKMHLTTNDMPIFSPGPHHIQNPLPPPFCQFQRTDSNLRVVAHHRCTPGLLHCSRSRWSIWIPFFLGSKRLCLERGWLVCNCTKRYAPSLGERGFWVRGYFCKLFSNYVICITFIARAGSIYTHGLAWHIIFLWVFQALDTELLLPSNAWIIYMWYVSRCTWQQSIPLVLFSCDGISSPAFECGRQP